MTKSLIIGWLLILALPVSGSASAAKPKERITSVKGPQRSIGGDSRGTKRLLSANKSQVKPTALRLPHDRLAALSTADHQRLLEVNLRAADNVKNPNQRRRAVAMAKRHIAKFEAEQGGTSWARGMEAEYFKQALATTFAESEATAALASVRKILPAIVLPILGGVFGILVGHDAIEVGQANTSYSNALFMAMGYANLGIGTYLALGYKQAKTTLARALDASYRAYVNMTEFDALIGRTK